MARPAEVVRVAIATVRRRAQLEAARDAAFEQTDDDKPTLLLADDEPVLLMVMADLFTQAGYAVVRVDSGNAAIRVLEREQLDVVVTDWSMDDGSGADLYRWIVLEKPWLAERVVFLTDVEGDDAAAMVPGRPVFRKGADSYALIQVLREIVRDVRHETAPPGAPGTPGTSEGEGGALPGPSEARSFGHRQGVRKSGKAERVDRRNKMSWEAVRSTGS
jgi:CheY-like chemotaxis protein